MSRRAVLLANLGSPDSTAVPDVRRYLREFLGDNRVLDKPAQPWRWLLLEGIILRSRPPKTAHAYSRIWKPEGSPLMIISRSVREKLAARLRDTPVYLTMRYGSPSAASALRRMADDGITDVLLFPQYPHYAMSSWETAVVHVREEAARFAPNIRIATESPFFADPDFIKSLHTVAAPFLAKPYDHVLFSYHGLPERHLRKADPTGCHCLATADCCTTPSPAHATCYRAQCFATTRALVQMAGIPPEKHSVSFQSRLGGEPWLSPFTDEVLTQLPGQGKKRLLVICPAFAADCLETIEEISLQGRDSFLEAGGESFAQIPCPNDDSSYIDFLAKRVQYWLAAGPV